MNSSLDSATPFFGIMTPMQERQVWIHCAKNMRVSCFMYLFQKHVLKLPEHKAKYPMTEIWQPEGVWQDLMQAVEAMFGQT
ncbi:MAG: hypothetical protein F6K19_35845 [Cyanothece sp. SIO1E1]|nr:hypothetical protein [Cyanothece sp. SIO1E1]